MKGALDALGKAKQAIDTVKANKEWCRLLAEQCERMEAVLQKLAGRLGLEWQNIGADRPVEGQELDHGELRDALKEKTLRVFIIARLEGIEGVSERGWFHT